MPALSHVNAAATMGVVLAIVVAVAVVVLAIVVTVSVVVVEVLLVALFFSEPTAGASKIRPPRDRWST